MSSTKESLPAVTVAGVVAIALGLFGALISLLGGVSMLVIPQLPRTPGAPATLPGTQAAAAVLMFFMFAVAVFGIFVGVGVIRRRNWARISIIIWAAFMTLVCLCVMAFSFVIFSAMPMQLPNTRPDDVANIMAFMKIFFVIFYGIPAAIGIWWLVLFTRKRVTTAFTNPAALQAATDPSGFPALPDASAAQPKRPSCPLPLAILAGLFIFSGVCMPLMVLMPSLYQVPFYFFGRILFGLEAKLILAGAGLVLGVCGVGILKLKPWGLHIALAVQGVFFVNGLFTIISPTFQAAVQEAFQKMSQYDAFPGGNPFLSTGFIRPAMVFGLLFGILILGLLVFFRSRFLEQAAAASAAKA
jgi:hypothetical protein